QDHETLGVDPGPALQEMYQRVLRADTELLALPAPGKPVPASAPVPICEFPVPAQLPASLTVFVGRDTELAEVSASFLGGTMAISAIAGMAGVGKSTFAVHWARRIADRFPDGQLYLNLRGFDPVGLPVPPEHALRILLESLGTDPRPLPSEVDALAGIYRTRLVGKRVLVLLDNVRDATQVRPLLPGEPGCLVIVTSRNRLSDLVALDGAHLQELDILSPAEARALLARRLGQQRVAAEPQAVEEIIAQCARLPLALAVTAARAAVRSAFSLETIAAELRDSASNLDAFHHSNATADVRAVFSWSYHALSPDAAYLFRLLSLHPGPDVTLPAAASLAGLTIPHTRHLLSELIQTHLTDETVPGRYASHDLLRTYAGELAATIDSPQHIAAARQRIFDHYLHTAREALGLTAERALIAMSRPAAGVRAEGFAGDTTKAAAWLAAEQAVLLAAVEQAATHRYDIHAWQLAWATANHLHWQGRWHEHERIHRTAMVAAGRLGDRTAKAHAHHGLATAAAALGGFDEARGHIERAVQLFAELGDTRALAESCRTMASVAKQQGDPKAALGAAQQFLAFQQAHNGQDSEDSRGRRATAAGLNAVAWCHTLLGQHEQALERSREALALCQELDCVTGAAETWDGIGQAHHNLGQYEQAVVAYRNALDLFRSSDFPWMSASTLERLGITYLSTDCPAAAGAVWTEALGVKNQLGNHANTESLRIRLRQLGQ
ncbi:ATP-binding protein, partial [Streptomyces aurantiacus]|uniref:ATP-binding protein n=1 Tax=Streptomyces aurantiacus TaxID=47760 RepID=UPI000B0382FB